MTDQTAAELEHEAELARARISDTADSLRNKMSPGQMIDEATSYFRGSDSGVAFGNLAGQIRDNPIPATLVGIGLAWLFASSGTAKTSQAEASSAQSRPDYSWDDDDLEDGRSYGRTSDSAAYDTAKSAASTATGAVASAASSVTGAVRSSISGIGAAVQSAAGLAGGAVNAASSGIGSTASGVGHAGSSARKAAYDAGAKVAGGAKQTGGFAQKQFTDLLSQEPMILAALGVAVGAAIGAAFPSTSLEDEAVGSYRDQLRDKIGDTANEAMAQASGLATDAYGTLKDAALQAGLGQQGEVLADAVKHVVTDTVETVQDAVQERLGGLVTATSDKRASGD